MFKFGPSAAGTGQLRRSLASGAVPSARESTNRATLGKTSRRTGARNFQPHHNNNVIKNHYSSARSMGKKGVASKESKLSSANVAGGVRVRSGRGPKPSNSTVDNRRVGRHERRGTAPAKHSSWPKKGKRPLVYMSGGFGKRRKVSTQKRSLRVQQHPLAEAFADSLSQTTADLSTTLQKILSDKVEILISRASATTALSRTYLTSASDLKENLTTSSYLLSGAFGEELEGFRRLVGEKRVNILALWQRWKECVDEIRQLGIGEATLAEARVGERGGGNRSSSAVTGHGSVTEGDAEFEKLIERISVVGDTWAKKMGDSEKKIADEELKQRELAASALS